MEGSPEWVELPLLIGEALVAINSPDALGYLETAAERIKQVKDPPVATQIRVAEHLGHFFRSVAKRPSKAKEHYVEAKSIAANAASREDVARIQLKICEIDLKTDADPQLANFQSLVRLGKTGFTSEEVLMAWNLLQENLSGLQSKMKAARGFRASADEYLLKLLKSVRNEDSK